jgi:hypothetical protein|tara:strand:+ start:151 stop:930 length:780 start_codon:yes stop_codon:yes gene_type:complete
MQLNLDCEKYDKYYVKRVTIPMVFADFNAKFGTSLPTDLGEDKETELRNRYRAKKKLYGRRNAGKVKLSSFLNGRLKMRVAKGCGHVTACECDAGSVSHLSGSTQSDQKDSSIDTLFSNMSRSHAKVDEVVVDEAREVVKREEIKVSKSLISDPMSFKDVMNIWLASKTSSQCTERAFLRRSVPLAVICTDMDAINAFVDSISFPVKKYGDAVIRFYNGVERRASKLKVRVNKETMLLNSEKASSYIEGRFLENKLVWM